MPCDGAHGRHVVRLEPSDHPSYVLRPVGVGVFRFYPYRTRRRKKTKTGWTASPPPDFPMGLSTAGRTWAVLRHRWASYGIGVHGTHANTPPTVFHTKSRVRSHCRQRRLEGRFPRLLPYCRTGRTALHGPSSNNGRLWSRNKKQSACEHLIILTSSVGS